MTMECSSKWICRLMDYFGGQGNPFILPVSLAPDISNLPLLTHTSLYAIAVTTT